jgi:predicted transcriptional regulator
VRRAKPKAIKSLVKSALGPLEEQVLSVISRCGRATVREVVKSLPRDLAYTTVMTTTDRLFQKGLLRRETGHKAYVYYPVQTASELQAQVARDLITAFVACADCSPDLLAVTLVDAVGAHKKSLLEEIEREIRVRRLRGRQRQLGRARFMQSRLAEQDWPIGHA